MLFREQGITITSIPMAIGMAIGVLVEVLLLGGGGVEGGGGKPPPKDEEGLKQRIKNKCKALSLLPGTLGVKWQKHCLVSLGRFSVGSSIKLQM